MIRYIKLPSWMNQFVIFGMIFINSDSKADEEATEQAINHACIHEVQMLSLLVVGWYVVFVLHFLINLLLGQTCRQAFKNVVFEKEALANEANPFALWTTVGWYTWPMYFNSIDATK